MKISFKFFFLILILLQVTISPFAHAEEEKKEEKTKGLFKYKYAEGLYIAPKFIYAHSDTTGWIDLDPTLKPFFHDDTFGNAIALGRIYKLPIPMELRFEIEYATTTPLEDTSIVRISAPPSSTGTTTTDLLVDFSTQSQTVFINLFIDYANSSNFTPYLGAGVGMVFNTTQLDVGVQGVNAVNLSFDKEYSQTFAASGHAGLVIDLTNFMALDLGYRFTMFHPVETRLALSSTDEVVLSSNNIIFACFTF